MNRMNSGKWLRHVDSTVNIVLSKPIRPLAAIIVVVVVDAEARDIRSFRNVFHFRLSWTSFPPIITSVL